MSKFEIALCILLALVVFGRLIGGLMGWLVLMFWIKISNPKVSKEEQARINKMWNDAAVKSRATNEVEVSND